MNDIEELVGDDILEISADDIQAVLGIIEDESDPKNLPAPPEVYKAVILDFFAKLTEVVETEDEDEE